MIPLCANEFLYRGIPRWDFGLDSPNKAATILAFLLLLLLAAILRTRRRWLAWSCTVLAAPIGYAFAHTFSRGGFVALLAGATAIVANHLHRQGGKRLLPLLLVAGMVAAKDALAYEQADSLAAKTYVNIIRGLPQAHPPLTCRRETDLSCGGPSPT